HVEIRLIEHLERALDVGRRLDAGAERNEQRSERVACRRIVVDEERGYPFEAGCSRTASDRSCSRMPARGTLQTGGRHRQRQSNRKNTPMPQAVAVCGNRAAVKSD